MKEIAKTTKRIIFVLALITIVACNNSDDINEIFIGHNWKLTYIEEEGIRRWPSQDKRYGLTFTENYFNASTPGGGKISGRWFADGKTREFNCSNIQTESIGANDTIGIQMVQIFNEATSYEGDIHYIQIKTENNDLMQFYNR